MLSSNAPQLVGVSGKQTLRTADLATQHEYAQVVDRSAEFSGTTRIDSEGLLTSTNLAPVFAVDVASWRQMVSWMWMDMLRDTPTIDTGGDALKARDLVVAHGTRILYKLRRPVTSGFYFGRKYTLWEVISVNTPRMAQSFECYYSDKQYRVLPKEG